MNFRFCSENADEKRVINSRKKGRARQAPSWWAGLWKQREVSGPLLWWCGPGWWKVRGLVYVLTLWTDCLMSKGGFGGVPAPDLSHAFFFLTCTALGGKPGLSTQGWCQQQLEQSSSSAASGQGVCCSPTWLLNFGGTQLAPLPTARGEIGQFGYRSCADLVTQ